MTQQVGFGPLQITYDDSVLTPRPWTLEQSRWAVALLDDVPAGPVLELCAGAGHIGLVVAVESGRRLVQVDIDARACELARANGERAGVRPDVRCGDLDRAVTPDERFALVLADPPYVPSDDVAGLPDDPPDAIHGGPDGLDVARQCVAIAAAHLCPGGAVLVQLGSEAQAELLGREVAEHGLRIAAVRAVGDAGVLVQLRGQRSASSERTSDACAAGSPSAGESRSSGDTGAS